MRETKAILGHQKKPCQKTDRAGGIASVLARLSLVGLLPSSAQLRFTKHQVLYATNSLLNEELINKTSAGTLESQRRAAQIRGRDRQSRWAPARRGDWSVPPTFFLPLAAWLPSTEPQQGSRLNNSLRRKKDSDEIWPTTR